MQTIWIVEDDDNISALVIYALEKSGFQPTGFGDGAAFLDKLRTELPALILLDIMLPGEDGISLLKTVRADRRTRDIPVIMLTAKSAEFDRVKGLDLGADDYITKPFSILELCSRVRSVLRRYTHEETGDGGLLTVGDITLDPNRRIVKLPDQEVSLTYKEFEMLHFLMLNRGIALSRDRIMQQVWGFDYEGETRTIDTHVLTLRQKLGEAGSLIKTVRNVGYKIGE